MRQSYYDRRDAQRWAYVLWVLAVALAIIALGYIVRERGACLARGGIYSTRADICFAVSAVVRP